MEELGFECIITRVIPLSEALEKHTDPIDEVLLARSLGCYSVSAVFENYFCLSPSYYFVSKKAIFQVSFVYLQIIHYLIIYTFLFSFIFH